MRKLIALVIGGLLSLNLFVSGVGANTELTHAGVYSDYSEYQAAVEATKATTLRTTLSVDDKQARWKEISMALSEADTHEKLEDVARQYRLVMYQPVTVEPLSGQSDIRLTAPTMVWDNISQSVEFSATLNGISDSAIRDDACNWAGFCQVQVDGCDMIGIQFSKWPASASFGAYYTVGRDKSGAIQWTAQTRDWVEQEPADRKIIAVSDQDKYLPLPSTLYDWYTVRTSAWIDGWPSGTLGGTASAFYAHTYAYTAVSKVTFNPQASGDKLQVGATIEFTNNTGKWTAQGPDLRY